MVDPARVRRLLAGLDEYRDRLAALRDLKADDYCGDHAFAAATWCRRQRRRASTWPTT
jgi:hypothetical protein